jgi:hypothetical protein
MRAWFAPGCAASDRRIGHGRIGWRKSHMTKEELLAALDKPRATIAVLRIVNPGASSADTVQTLLMEMREAGLVKFDIRKGLWSRA